MITKRKYHRPYELATRDFVLTLKPLCSYHSNVIRWWKRYSSLYVILRKLKFFASTSWVPQSFKTRQELKFLLKLSLYTDLCPYLDQSGIKKHDQHRIWLRNLQYYLSFNGLRINITKNRRIEEKEREIVWKECYRNVFLKTPRI